MSDDARMVKTKFWDDAFVCSLDVGAKLLYLYLLTNQSTNCAGCYEISMRRIIFDTGLIETVCIGYLDQFQKSGRIMYQDGWVSLKNFAKNQNFTSPQVQKGIKKIVDLAPLAHRVYLGYTYHIDTAGGKEVEVEKKRKEITPGASAKEKKVFSIPTLQEVADYIAEVKAGISPEAFINHYQSNGWKVGKNPMKCWQSAVRTWKHNNLSGAITGVIIKKPENVFDPDYKNKPVRRPA